MSSLLGILQIGVRNCSKFVVPFWFKVITTPEICPWDLEYQQLEQHEAHSLLAGSIIS